jgi:hypothetical protein
MRRVDRVSGCTSFPSYSDTDVTMAQRSLQAFQARGQITIAALRRALIAGSI